MALQKSASDFQAGQERFCAKAILIFHKPALQSTPNTDRLLDRMHNQIIHLWRHYAMHRGEFAQSIILLDQRFRTRSSQEPWFQ